MMKNKGFTLIELVVVIAILAILAAVAVPKFAEISDQAHSASVEAVGGSYASAVTLVRAQWLANGVQTERCATPTLLVCASFKSPSCVCLLWN